MKTSLHFPLLLLAQGLLFAPAELAAAEPNEVTAGSVEVHPGRGFYDRPIRIEAATKPASTLWYSLDGSLPSPSAGNSWPGFLQVSNTTILRVASYIGERRQGEVQTATYVYPRQVLRQTGAGFPKRWGVTNGHPVQADYEMDPEIVDHPEYRDRMEPALRAIPSISVVMEQNDLFEPVRGIYANPMQSGDAWERPASVELINPDGRPGFQVNCGIRIQGGWNRRPEESPKHAFRLAFRKQHGPGKLRFPLFPDPGANTFDSLILRAGCNNTWLHWDGAERRRGDFLRDQWMRDTMREMGHPSPRGMFVHLYLNGLYWGLYNLTERPNEAFAASHYGGSKEMYDSRNGANILEGTDAAWLEMMRLVNAGVEEAGAYQAVEGLLDVPHFIDYMIVNLYGANADWDRASNWYAARRREPPGKFHFFVWDGERTLEEVDANRMDQDDDQSPTRLFQRLRKNTQFRAEWKARAAKHLSGEGVLGPKAAGERFNRLARRIQDAVVAESARWGDYRRDVHPYKAGPYELYTPADHWAPEINRLLQEFFPRRSDVLRAQAEAL